MWKFLIVALFSVVWALTVSQDYNYEDFELGKTSTGCNSSLNLNNSKIELNNHTLIYPCHWNITAHGKITFFFFDIFLYETDKLNIYKSLEDAEAGKNPLLKNDIKSQNGTITIITNETALFVYVKGGFHGYDRVLDGYYSASVCSVPVPPTVEILYSPIYVGEFSEPMECDYRFNEIPHKRVKQAFTFEEFNMPASAVTIQGSSLSSGEYTSAQHPTDFFIQDKVLFVTVKLAINSSDHFRLKIHEVDSACSHKIEFINKLVGEQMVSPPNVLDNGTITSFECRWLLESKNPSEILGIKFDKLNFASVFDIVAINDGRSEISPPLLQVTLSNRNETQNQVIRASSSYLWVAFKPRNYESSFVGNITVHGQGGFLRHSGEVKMNSTTLDDTVFLLEVEDNEIVMLDFDASSITPPAAVSVYDGFTTNNLLTVLHGQVKFPVLSRSSRMMVTGSKFSGTPNSFSAKFKGVATSCNQMSTSSSENFILSENCNSSCVWIIPPQNASESESALVVYLQYIALKEGDELSVHKLDADLTQLVSIRSNQNYVPHISVPADVGVLINVTQAECKVKTDKIIFIGHSSYIPACSKSIVFVPKTSEFHQISSPLYPDTYPVFSKCYWNVTADKGIAQLTFQSLNLANNHCIKISQNSKVINQFEGKTLPNDLFLQGDVLVEFDSAGCNKTIVDKTLKSDAGFLLNMTLTDCGAIYDGKDSGEFNTNINGSQTICIWKVSVPPTNNKASVNIISFTVNEKDKLNYEFSIYDGSSVRDKQVNITSSQMLSRTNNLIFVYKRLNASQSSGVVQISYKKLGCDTLCQNGICMQSDWRCNGQDDCGDFSDERNCGSVPLPPEIRETGYSSTAFWLSLIAMTVIGVILGVIVPVLYQRYKDSRYRRFHELETS